VVGGGYVGLEAAASARALGAEAVVIERMDRVLARVASQPLSAFFTELHRARGVEILTGVEVAGFEDDGVRLADGTLIAADAVLVGVGAFACEALARTAGLTCENGVVVDETARTSDPNDLRHRRCDPPAHPRSRRAHAPAGERAQRPGAGQAGRRRHRRPRGSSGRSAVVLVGPV
jgi:NADPH-dependent 2,4-dienoyl-CoA reductase/sulfur reductase-like enzyme